MPGGRYPFWIVIKEDAKAYVSSQRDDELVVLDLMGPSPTVSGRIRVGSQPNKMILNRAQTLLYVAHGNSGKSNAGPNPGACRHTLSIAPDSLGSCSGRNQYIWQLTKAGFLGLPLPAGQDLVELTWQVAENNDFPVTARRQEDHAIMEFLRRTITSATSRSPSTR